MGDKRPSQSHSRSRDPSPEFPLSRVCRRSSSKRGRRRGPLRYTRSVSLTCGSRTRKRSSVAFAEAPAFPHALRPPPWPRLQTAPAQPLPGSEQRQPGPPPALRARQTTWSPPLYAWSRVLLVTSLGDQPTRELAAGSRMPVLGLGVWQMAAGSRDRAGGRMGARGRLPPHRHGLALPQRAERRRRAETTAAAAGRGLRHDEAVPTHPSAARELAKSLERLGLDYVDLYLIHWPVPLAERAALAPVRVAPGPRAWHARSGSATSASTQLEAMAQAARRPRSTRCSSARSTTAGELLDYCPSTASWSRPTARSSRAGPSATPRSRGLAERLGRTPAQVMLRWALQHEAVVIPSRAAGPHPLERARSSTSSSAMPTCGSSTGSTARHTVHGARR